MMNLINANLDHNTLSFFKRRYEQEQGHRLPLL